ncbi:FecR domain-containing protein, partial [Roseovarius ramblicola]
MRFSGSIDGSQDGPDIVLRSSDGEAVTIQDPALLFSADFSREGTDLVLKNPGSADIRVVDYFADGTPADLTTPDGATLRGAVVDRLAGPEAPGQYAQAGAVPQGIPIGQVETLEGTARAQRSDGTVVELEVGAKVYQNDVVITDPGGNVSLTFADGTIFTLASGSRMVLDELIYSTDSEENSAAFSLVEGSFVFIAGQVAKTGDMDVTTPSATMGIRGTTVLVDVQTIDGVTTVEVSLNTDPDGGLGEIVVSDLNDNEIATITATDTKWLVPVGGQPFEIERTASDFASDSDILADAARAYATALARLEAGETFVELDSGGSRAGSGDVNLAPSGGDGSGEGEDDGSDGENEGQDGTTTFPDFGIDPNKLDSDDDARLAPDATGAGTEDRLISGAIVTNDLDGDGAPDPATFSPTNGEGSLPPGVIFAADGSYTLDATDPAYQDLAEGEQRDVIIDFTATSGDITDTGSLTVTVTGVNDAPTFAPGALATVEDAAVTFNLATLGSDADSDNTGTTLGYAITGDPAEGTASISGTTLSFAPGAAFQDLAQGETRDVTIGITATDAHGDTATNDVTVTVTGTNDGPALAADTLAAVEDGPSVDVDLATLGADIDSDNTGTTLGYAITGDPAEGTA